MDFAPSRKVQELAARIARFMDENVYPAEPVFAAEVEDNRKCGDPWVATKIMEQLKAKARAAGLWNLFLPESDLGAGLTQSRIRAAMRNHGPVVDRARGIQLQRTRHRQHGSARALRDGRAEETLAGAASARRDPLGDSR